MLERLKASFAKDKGIWFVAVAFAGMTIWAESIHDGSLAFTYACVSVAYFIALFHPPVDDWFTFLASRRMRR